MKSSPFVRMGHSILLLLAAWIFTSSPVRAGVSNPPSTSGSAKSSLAFTLDSNGAVSTGEITVAADGTGNFTTIQAAIDAEPDQSQQKGLPHLIHLKPGTYHEVVIVPAKDVPIELDGEDPATTKITYANAASILNAEGKPMGTSHSATFFVFSNNFTARNITFENSFGKGSQALAISVNGDRDAFYHCNFLGFQDTILAQNGRQYFGDCGITGAVDFIFGSATAWFQHCDIHCTAPGYITAANTPQDHPYGYIFNDCNISGDPGVKTFLGRPWRPYAAVTYLNCTMSDVVQSQGWHPWNKTDPGTTTRYIEFGTKGPGASPDTRVAWATKITDSQAAALTPQSVFTDWNPVLTAN